MYVSLRVRTGSPLRRKWARSGEEKGGSLGEKASDTYVADMCRRHGSTLPVARVIQQGVTSLVIYVTSTQR